VAVTTPRRAAWFSVVDVDDGHLRDLVLGALGPVLVCLVPSGDPRRGALASSLAQLSSTVRVRCVLAAPERCPTTAVLLGSQGDDLLLLVGGRLRARISLGEPWPEVRALIESALSSGTFLGPAVVFGMTQTS
jgi:hypothetical protein